MYIWSGYPWIDDDIYRFDLTTNTWIQPAPTGVAPATRQEVDGILTKNNTMLLWAGLRTACDPVMRRYDPVANTWTSIAAR